MINRDMIEQMKQEMAGGVQIISAPQLFPTPREVAERMAELLLGSREANDFHILEPSAGTGMLIGALGASWYPGGSLTAVEVNRSLCNKLENDFPLSDIRCDDFLNVDYGEYFDRVIMNPPFKNGEDIKHIKHALSMLKEGGLLVAICAGGPRQERELMPLCDSWERLPAGTFKEQGTMVNSVLLTIRK